MPGIAPPQRQQHDVGPGGPQTGNDGAQVSGAQGKKGGEQTIEQRGQHLKQPTSSEETTQTDNTEAGINKAGYQIGENKVAILQGHYSLFFLEDANWVRERIGWLSNRNRTLLLTISTL